MTTKEHDLNGVLAVRYDAALPASSEGGEGFGCSYLRAGPQLGLKKLAMCVYEVPPGKRMCPYHAHGAIEEMFVIVSGRGTWRFDGREREVSEGDIVGAPTGKPHQLINTSDAPIRYLAISTNESTDVVLYPDSGKVQGFSDAFDPPLVHVGRLEDAVPYMDGEVGD